MNTDLFDVAVSVVAETEKSFLHDPRRDTCVLHIFNLVLLFITALHCNVVHGNILIYMCRSTDNRLGLAFAFLFPSLPFPLAHYIQSNSSNVLRPATHGDLVYTICLP